MKRLYAAYRVAVLAGAIILLALCAEYSDAYDIIRSEYLFEIRGAEGISFSHPTDLVISNSRIYVLDGLNKRVAVFDLQGRHLFSFQGAFIRPVGLCSDQRGIIYVTDADNGKVSAFSGDGAMVSQFAVSPAAKGETPDIKDCAISAKDEIFFTDNRNHHVQVYRKTGERLRVFGTYGLNDNELRYPATISIDEVGTVYVVDVINTSVKGFMPSGELSVLIGKWGMTPGRLYRPKGVFVHGKRVFVSDSYTGAVQVYDLSGRFLALIGDKSGQRIRFTTPTNMYISGNRLYIMEQLKHRVSVWKIDGER